MAGFIAVLGVAMVVALSDGKSRSRSSDDCMSGFGDMGGDGGSDCGCGD